MGHGLIVMACSGTSDAMDGFSQLQYACDLQLEIHMVGSWL